MRPRMFTEQDNYDHMLPTDEKVSILDQPFKVSSPTKKSFDNKSHLITSSTKKTTRNTKKT